MNQNYNPISISSPFKSCLLPLDSANCKHRVMDDVGGTNSVKNSECIKSNFSFFFFYRWIQFYTYTLIKCLRI